MLSPETAQYNTNNSGRFSLPGDRPTPIRYSRCNYLCRPAENETQQKNEANEMDITIDINIKNIT
jgi:hypothetical protein